MKSLVSIALVLISLLSAKSVVLIDISGSMSSHSSESDINKVIKESSYLGYEFYAYNREVTPLSVQQPLKRFVGGTDLASAINHFDQQSVEYMVIITDGLVTSAALERSMKSLKNRGVYTCSVILNQKDADPILTQHSHASFGLDSVDQAFSKCRAVRKQYLPEIKNISVDNGAFSIFGDK
jgi:uncharacterized protein with von Willebrand factor type A (vWA) domain